MQDILPETLREIASRCDRVGALALSHSCVRFHDELECIGLRYLSPSAVMETAVRNGHIRVVKWLYSIGLDKKAIKRENFSGYALYNPIIARILDVAAVGAHYRVFKWLHAQGFKWGSHVLSAAVYGGNIKVAKLVARTCDMDFDMTAFSVACALGNLNMIKCLLKQPGNQHSREHMLLSPAIAMGHLHVIKWLTRRREYTGKYQMCHHMICAAYNGHFHIVQFFAEKIDGRPSNITTTEELDEWMVAHTGARYSPCILSQYERVDSSLFILNKFRARYGKK